MAVTAAPVQIGSFLIKRRQPQTASADRCAEIHDPTDRVVSIIDDAPSREAAFAGSDTIIDRRPHHWAARM